MDKITQDRLKEFKQKFCMYCGSQRCTAEGEWLEECKHYKEEIMKELKQEDNNKHHMFSSL